MQPDINNIEVPDWVAVGSALLLFIALFLPWIHVSVGAGGFSVSGSTGASFGWVSIISVLAVFTIWVLTLLDVELPFPSGLAYLGAGAFSVLFTILVMLVRPVGGTVGGLGISKYPWIGAFVGFVAGVGIVVGGWMKYKAQRY